MDSVASFETALAHPDPEPESLEVPPGYLPTEEVAVVHAVKAIRKLRDRSDALEAIWEKENEAYQHAIAALELKEQALRLMVKDFIVRRGGDPIRTPQFTASVAKGRARLDILDEAKALQQLRDLNAPEAIRIKESIDHKAFETIYNANPRAWKGIAEQAEGNPTLRITEKG